MEVYRYLVILTPASEFAAGESGFVVTAPAFPEVHTQGEDQAEALAAGADAIEEALAGRLLRDEPFPPPDASRRRRGKRDYSVAPSLAIVAKGAIRNAMRQRGFSNARLARALRCDEKAVRRLLNPRWPSKPAQLRQALAFLGKQMVIGIGDAA